MSRGRYRGKRHGRPGRSGFKYSPGKHWSHYHNSRGGIRL